MKQPKFRDKHRKVNLRTSTAQANAIHSAHVIPKATGSWAAKVLPNVFVADNGHHLHAQNLELLIDKHCRAIVAVGDTART